MTLVDKAEKWKAALDQASSLTRKELFTGFEIRQYLKTLVESDGSLLSGLHIGISHQDVLFDTGPLGKTDGAQLSVQNDPLVDDDVYTARLEAKAWEVPGSHTSTGQWFTGIRQYLHGAWLPEAREKTWGLLDYKNETVKKRLPASLERLAKNFPSQKLFFVWMDLDKFKQVNDQYGHDVGDSALKHAASCIESLSSEAIVLGFLNGGDEFCLVIAGKSIGEVLKLLRVLSQRIQSKGFGAQGVKVSFTAGIAPIADCSSIDTVNEAMIRAEKSTKFLDEGGVEQKKRETVSVHGQIEDSGKNLSLSDFMQLAIVMARSFQDSDAPFANILLNLISATVCEAIENGKELTAIGPDVNTALCWLGLKISPTTLESNLIGPDNVTPTVYSGAVAVAVGHGVLQALAKKVAGAGEDSKPVPGFKVQVSRDGSSAALCSTDGSILWGTIPADGAEFAMGSPITRENRKSTEPFSSAIAFRIGFQGKVVTSNGTELPTTLFSETIVVDDRPKIGGGLPDFWQAAIANTISAIGTKSNFEKLLVIGAPDNAPETVKRLKGDIQLNIDELAVVTALPREVVEKCIVSIRQTGALQFVSEFNEILQTLYATSLGLVSWKKNYILDSSEAAAKLKRKLVDDGLTLGSLDGIRCETAAQAYPMIVEILRTSESVNTTYDDASQPLGEVVGFKLALERPLQDPIPDYWQEQKNHFETYAQDVLLDSTGLIGSAIHEAGQFEAFVEQLASYCTVENSKKSTRRAILVVKNNVDEGSLRPLGLVSVWAAPRHSANGCHIEFCFVWRTVETLVGLPYSLYGSIAFAKHVLDEISRSHAKSGISSRLNIGRLTYLALSLHMRVDKFHRRIAKRIADAASD